MTLNAVLIAVACVVAVLAICALIFIIMLPRWVKMTWLCMSFADKFLKIMNKNKTRRK